MSAGAPACVAKNTLCPIEPKLNVTVWPAETRSVAGVKTRALVAAMVLPGGGGGGGAGRNDVAAVDDLVGDQHYLSLNLDSAPLKLEVKEPHGFKPFVVPPQSLWVSPSANPITLRLNSTLRYLRVSIDPVHLSRLISPSLDEVGPVHLRRTYAVESPQIRHLMLALKYEADSRNAHGLAMVEAVTSALGHLLV